MAEFIPFGSQFSLEARAFGFQQYITGNGEFWHDVLQLHDTYGVPFDLIWLKIRQALGESLMPLTSEQFTEHMRMTRYGAENYGLPMKVLPA